MESVPSARTEPPETIARSSTGVFWRPFGARVRVAGASLAVTPSSVEIDPEAAVVADAVRADPGANRGVDHLDAVQAVEGDRVLGRALAADRVAVALDDDPGRRVPDVSDTVGGGADEVAGDAVPVATPLREVEDRDPAAVAGDDVATDRVVVRGRQLDPVSHVAGGRAGRVDAEEVPLDGVVVAVEQDSDPVPTNREPANRRRAGRPRHEEAAPALTLEVRSVEEHDRPAVVPRLRRGVDDRRALDDGERQRRR